MRRTLSGFRAAALLASMSQLLAACGERQVTVASPPFEAVFELSEVIELGEDPADSIAEVGVFVERRDGGFIIGDRLLPRVRTYAEDGSLEAGFGRFGEGPWELQRVSSVAKTASGRIVVASPYTRWLTYLNSDLSPDTLVGIGDYWVFQMFPFRQDIVFYGIGRSRSIHDVAVQDGYFHRLVDGSVVGTIGTPPPSFRRVPVIEAGAYATSSPGGQDFGDLLGTFDLVPRIDAVERDFLVFTLGRLDETKPYFPLYVLQNPDIPPWRIAKYRLLAPD